MVQVEQVKSALGFEQKNKNGRACENIYNKYSL